MSSGRRSRIKAAHINHERWMVSFADFMTLLFALFVVLFAISSVDQKKLNEVAASVEEAFGVMDSQGSSLLNHRVDTIRPIPPVMQHPSPPPPAEDSENLKKLAKVIGKNVQLAGAVQLRQESRGVVIQLKDTRLFASGSAELRPEILPELRKMAKELEAIGQSLRIEGHTDNVPINGSGMYHSNWELSAARATSVLRFLLGSTHVPPQSYSVAGYGEYRPIASNATEAGRARNRRVDIVILNNQAMQAEPDSDAGPQDELNQQLNQKLQQKPQRR